MGTSEHQVYQRTTITVKEAAHYIGISEWLTYELAKRGEIPCIRLGGRILFRLESVNKYLESKESESTQKVIEPLDEGYGVLRRAKV